jgi:hypothetical protein
MVQVISPRLPWQVALSSQVLPMPPAPGQSVVLAQQIPSLQQKPLSQWLLSQSVSSSQAIPFAKSSSHTPKSQCARAMQRSSRSTPPTEQAVAQKSPADPLPLHV